ncbi:MAP7 domain-containing protein 2-like isoform X5 [Salvelinus fontinalis]|uniref:MAP7 domain-containing protein 2-like isoform X5 n=1 Tax=Salvelinus fontinalis TaxID=8038 RepID=UPI00248550E9|nr:MAP7 domain-containing protein 2-like isoform X5 [Salvelinus fontinalis]
MTTAKPGAGHQVTGSLQMDRVQLVRGRREEREKSHEEVLRDKEQRVRQQLEHCADKRGRKMEEQKRREEERRAAVEERRRQQDEKEKERLEALVRRRERTGERDRQMGEDSRYPMENRPKRWTWGGPPGGEEVCGVSPRLASPSPQRPAYKCSPSRKASNGPPEDKTPRTPTTEKGPTSCLTDSSMRRLESPTTPTRSSSPRAHSKAVGTPKRVRSTKSRAQSPCSPGQYPPSPLRQRPPVTEGNHEARGHGTLERKSSKLDATEKKIPKSCSRDLAADSPGTPTGRNVAGTTDAEEASRLLAERRRLARVQKEQEDKLRQEEERLKAEEELRREQEARERQAREAQRAEEERERREGERERREEERKSREEEERRTKERRWKDMQDQLDREREEACLRAHREAERKRQERELQQVQEEQERLQRKKRIEEIMKRTRKSEKDSSSSGVCDVNRGQAGQVRELDQDESPLITLGPLERKTCGGDELSDGVQSMDVSPVSRDDLGIVQDFSPVSEALNSMSNARTLEHLLDLTTLPETPPYPRLQPGSAAAMGDLNKNLLIQGYNPASLTSSSPRSAQLLHSLSPGKLDV